jgi:hypothetical protein
MRKFALAFVLAGLVAMPTVSNAEITWTDIGGDIYLLYYYSANVADFNDDAAMNDDGDLFRSEIHLNFKADLDDDVSVGISLEADRDLESIGAFSSTNFGSNSLDGFGDVGDLAVFLEEAYVKVVEPFGWNVSVIGGRFFANWGDDSTADDFNGYWGDTLMLGDGDAGTPATLNALGDWETDPFDGVVASFDFDAFTVDALWLLATDQNDFGDRAHDTELLGLYGSYLDLEAMQVDAYFLWINSDGNKNFNPLFMNKIDQFTVGARLAGACMDDEIAYKIEGAYQFGDVEWGAAGDGDFDAFVIEAGVNWHPDHDLNPELGFIYTFQSGGSDPQDVEFYTAPFEAKGYGMIADNFTFSNTHVFHIDGDIDLAEDVRLETDWYYFLLDDDDQAIQTLGGDAFVGALAPSDDSLGWEVDAQIDYTYSENVDAFVGAGIFVPDDAVDDAVGSDDEAYFIRTGVKVAF